MSVLIDIGAAGRRRLYRQRRTLQRSQLLTSRYGHLDGGALLQVMACEIFPKRIAVVSSFGTESAVLLDLVAQVDPSLPVLFLDSGRHFSETLDHVHTLRAHFGLTDVRILTPDGRDIAANDPHGELAARNPDLCCHLRKSRPLAQALAPFDAWVTGRKRFQGGERSGLARIEAVEQHIKINPLAAWSQKEIAQRFLDRGLPLHPLAARGFTSVGCAPCTELPQDGGDARSGRWATSQKTECGIHKAPWAKRA